MTGSTELQRVTGDLRNRFLHEHNAAFFGGRTFRWVTPIPIFTVTGDARVDRLILEQFLAWEAALGGAGGVPFYSPQAVARQVPPRGIFFATGDLPGQVVGLGNPFFTPTTSGGGGGGGGGAPPGPPPASPAPGDRGVAFELRRQLPPTPVRRVEVPEVLSSGQIQRCVIVLDPVLDNVSDTALRTFIRHEVGHCLGFIGHVSSGLMRASPCFPCRLNITSDVSNMMRQLYNLPPGTEVTR
jgi:hypothetical protein